LTPQDENSVFGSNSTTQQVVSNFIAPVVLAEPGGNGSIVHLAQSGQFLWLLAHHYDVSIDRLRELNQMGADDIIYIGQEILIQPPIPATATPENPPSITKASQNTTVQRVIETSAPSLIEAKKETRGSDINLYYLLFFAIFGIGLILVVIGIQQH